MRRNFRLIGSLSKLRARIVIEVSIEEHEKLPCEILIDEFLQDSCNVYVDNVLVNNVRFGGYFTRTLENLICIDFEYAEVKINIQIFFPLEMEQPKYIHIFNDPCKVNNKYLPMNIKWCLAGAIEMIVAKQKLQDITGKYLED